MSNILNCPFRPPNPVMETLLLASQVIKILKVLKEVLNAYSKQDQMLLTVLQHGLKDNNFRPVSKITEANSAPSLTPIKSQSQQ
ncbi:hypothetical protein TSAR_008496, partial [Trichomalopsis sarcophagae]